MFFARSRALLCQEHLGALLPADHPLFPLIAQVRRSGVMVTEHDVELTAPRFHHEDICVHACAVPEWPDRVMLVFQDFSSTRALDRQLTFRSAARSVSGMAAVLAHEVKNPLSGIRGAAQLLESSVSEADRELAVLIRDEADRIRALVERMEMFGKSRSDGGRSTSIKFWSMCESSLKKALPQASPSLNNTILPCPMCGSTATNSCK